MLRYLVNQVRHDLEKSGRQLARSEKYLARLEKQLKAFEKPKSRKATGFEAERRKRGYFSRNDIAARCRVATVSITHSEKAGRFSAPTHKYPFGGNPSHRFYKSAEAKNIEEIMRERKGFTSSGRPRGKLKAKRR